MNMVSFGYINQYQQGYMCKTKFIILIISAIEFIGCK